MKKTPIEKMKKLNISKNEKIRYLEIEKEKISQKYDKIIKKIIELRQEKYFLETSKKNAQKIEKKINSNLEKRYKYEKENVLKEEMILEIENKLFELKNNSYKNLVKP